MFKNFLLNLKKNSLIRQLKKNQAIQNFLNQDIVMLKREALRIEQAIEDLPQRHQDDIEEDALWRKRDKDRRQRAVDPFA